MSARISGVKNFVSIGDSFVRALPVSQVKSANANGSVLADLVWAEVPGGATEATPFSTGKTLELAPFVAATVETFVLPVAAAEATARLHFDSSSATRFSSCSMRSSIQRSRSVSGIGESGFARADFADGLLVSLSSASERNGMTMVQRIAAKSRRNFLPLSLNARISCS